MYSYLYLTRSAIGLHILFRENLRQIATFKRVLSKNSKNWFTSCKICLFFQKWPTKFTPFAKTDKSEYICPSYKGYKNAEKNIHPSVTFKNEHADPLTSEKNDHCEGQENCELLKAVDSEEPENLKEDNNFDYYKLLQPHRVSLIRICFVIQNV